VLGTVTGARTFMAPAALALRGRLGKAARFVMPAIAAGELVGDKLPMAPPRVEGPGLVGRVVSGAVCGRVSGGTRGARVGAAFALATTYPSQTLRAQIAKRPGIPDIACAVPEDLLGASLAAAASTEPRPDVDGPKSPDIEDLSAHQHGALASAGLGLAAGAVGAAAMSSAREWVFGFTGEEGSNPAVHVLHGTGWGLLFGVAWGRGRLPGPDKGAIFGLNVWLASLVALPALGVAPPPWKQSPAALARDLGLHLVYGTATAAAYEAFSA
jgi:uncharacterized membrane protein